MPAWLKNPFKEGFRMPQPPPTYCGPLPDPTAMVTSCAVLHGGTGLFLDHGNLRVPTFEAQESSMWNARAQKS